MKAINTVRTPEIDDILYRAFFSLQTAVEREGVMDYQRYAQKLWEALGFDINDENFAQFKADLISELKDIEMADLVEPAIIDSSSLDRLISLPGKVAAYSTGDVHSTGYQLSKFQASGIKWLVARSLRRQGKTKQGSFKEKVYIIIDEKKAEALAKAIESMPAEERPKKIILIDDRLFKYGDDEVATLKDLKAALNGQNIEIIPVWYTNARLGHNLKAKDPEEFARANDELNGIDSLSIISTPPFQQQVGGINEDTLILVDGDGVTWDNVEMRQRQIEAKLRAITRNSYLGSPDLIAAVLSENLDLEY